MSASKLDAVYCVLTLSIRRVVKGGGHKKLRASSGEPRVCSDFVTEIILNSSDFEARTTLVTLFPRALPVPGQFKIQKEGERSSRHLISRVPAGASRESGAERSDAPLIGEAHG